MCKALGGKLAVTPTVHFGKNIQSQNIQLSYVLLIVANGDMTCCLFSLWLNKLFSADTFSEVSCSKCAK